MRVIVKTNKIKGFKGLQNLTMYSDNLKKLRIELKLSAQKLADSLGVAQMSLSNYETGKRKPTFEFLEQLHTIYNVNLNWFVTGKGEMFNATQNEQSEKAITQKVYEILRQEGVIK